MSRSLVRRLAAALLSLAFVPALATPSAAHRPSDSFLSLTAADDRVEGRWDLALRDLEHAIGLDSDRDGAVTWGELKARHGEIAAYALARLTLESAGARCAPQARDHLVEDRSDGAYAVLKFAADCPGAQEALTVGYDFLFDLDPLHRGLAQVKLGEETRSLIFSPEQRRWQLEAGRPDLWLSVVTYLREGVWHIWIGLDHILFLVSLLLPAVLRREGGAWQPAGSLRDVGLETVKVVTAFTLAHSITLVAASLEWVVLPGRPVEAIIALSIVLAALNNIFPLVTRGLWAVAFGFGLVHGLGFAGALAELGLPSQALLPALVSFNVGVELGQLAIVALLLPPAFLLARTQLYPRLVLQGGSLAIAAVAGLWVIERSLPLA